jgi:geranylgeranyl pyrophosphate synthase
MPGSVPASAATSAVGPILAAAVALADAALERELPPADAAPARLHAAMRYSVFAGGKRLRPALVLAACRACGGADAACAPGMAAVELLHTYTLIHDDLPAMDDDDLRRGRPTCHKAFDEATAILAGDALQAQAFAAAATLGAPAVAALARAAGSVGVVGGQQEDLDAEGLGHAGTGDRAGDVALLERIHRGKTAALIRASCQLGGLAAGAGPAALAALVAYGEALGLAFQIADDVLDATASAEALGKTPGKDAKAGKLTYVACYGLDGARAQARRRGDEALAALAPFGAAGGDLAALARFAVERDH